MPCIAVSRFLRFVQYYEEEEEGFSHMDLPGVAHSFGVSPTYAVACMSAPDIPAMAGGSAGAGAGGELDGLDSARGAGAAAWDGPASGGAAAFAGGQAQDGPQPPAEIKAFGSTLFRGETRAGFELPCGLPSSVCFAGLACE